MGIRVAMLAPEFLPVWGGVGTYAVELVRNFPEDVEVHVITPFRERIGDKMASSADYDFEKMFGNNVHIHFLSKARDTFIYNAKFQLAIWRSLKDIVRREGINIVHSAGGLPDLLINPSELEVPIVNTIHSTLRWQINDLREISFSEMEFSEKMTKILALGLKWLEDMYYKKRFNLITVSQFGKKRIVKENNIPCEYIEVIHNGVDVERFTPQNRRKAKELYGDIIEKEGVKVLYLSRFVARKGFNLLLRAIPEVLKKVDAHFIFAGPGIKPNFEVFRIPKGTYTYLGYVYPPDYLYSIADIFVLPSFTENFPMSVLEAMASEVCVLATNVGGIPEMVKNKYNGLLIPTKDVDALIRSLVYLIENDRERKKMAKNARRTVVEKFTWKKSAELTLEYYKEILEEGK
ncbi:glycosyltransferase family 4 protein [Thermococcus alcaliphilus]|uniref:glycosyltransferase family 4 protein n=1 Tax=Thermococcus alcaliphilus TaxID=139207 RepID=UPI0020901B59|nr:glycosyltransferase family 4 protein [Thermococcus alcaliphilus]MCO6042252.1 glycosyltransferase family 4 protein [Thermococcus alcaliphilus]